MIMKLQFILFAFFCLILTSCEVNQDIDDTQDLGNQFVIQNDKFELKNAVLRNYGFYRDDTYYEGSLKYLYLASEKITFDKVAPCGEIQGIGDFIVWEIFTKSEFGLDEGKYTFFNRLPNLNGKPFTFSLNSAVALNWVNPTYDGGAEKNYDMTGGELTITKEGQGYKFVFNVTLENGKSLSGSLTVPQISSVKCRV
jgi:hypothetical protein